MIRIIRSTTGDEEFMTERVESVNRTDPDWNFGLIITAGSVAF